MEKVIEIFEQIKNTSSTNDKKKIILENKDNELFKKCLKFLLDGNIVTGISDKKIAKRVIPSSELAPYWISMTSSFEEVMDYLMKHNTGTDDDVYEIQAFLLGNEENREFYEQMITKKYRLGCDSKTVSQCIPGLITRWDIQQAYPISEKNEPKDGEWFALSQKLNGTNNGVYGYVNISRQGKPYVGLEHITKDLEQLSFKNMFFNGELIRKNEDNLPDSENFQLGTGIINSSTEDKSSIKFVIYEMFPEEEFDIGESKLTYKQRREKYLNPLAEEIERLGLENIEVVPIIYEGTDKSKIQELLEMADANGWEGLMLNKDTRWKNKRNNGILKVKSFLHADIKCTGIVEGEGRLKGTLGLIKCDYKGCELGVGSGFTDEQRNYFWNNPHEIIDKIVQVKYKGESKNKKGGVSVQFPIFETVRYDKSEPSYN